MAHGKAFAAEPEVFQGRHKGVKFGNVGQITDMAVGCGLTKGDLFSRDEDLALVRAEKAEDGFHGGRFARAVAADEAVDAMLGNGEIKSAQDLLFTEALFQTLDRENVHVSYPPCRE